MPLIAKLRSLFRREKLERDMAEEMRAHIEEQTALNLAAGMSPDEAHAAAHRQFGGVAQIQEQGRDVRAWVGLESWLRDVRYALRSLRRSPGFAVTIILVLGLGIGSNTAVFSVVNSLLLRPMAIAKPHDLWALVTTNEAGRSLGYTIATPYFEMYRDGTRSFASFAGYAPLPAEIEIGEVSERLQIELVSGNYFSTVGLQPASGRFIATGDDKAPTGGPVIVISHELWRRHFSDVEDPIGAIVVVNDQALTVIGVAPAGFGGFGWTRGAQAWVPHALEEALGAHANMQMMGRLKAGVSPDQAVAELNAITQSISESYRQGVPGHSGAGILPSWLRLRLLPAAVGALSAQSAIRERVPMLAGLFMGAVGFVLLIACANAANLLLARASQRRKEIAVRLALGADRSRLVRQLFTESLLLASLGGVVGILLAYWGSRALLTFRAGWLQSIPVDPTPDWRVLIFTLAVAITTGLAFGLAPAFQALRFDLNPALKQSQSTIGGVRFPLRNLLSIAQVAVCVVLLAGAGLCVRSFARLITIDPGFDLNVLTASIALDEERYSKEEAHLFLDRLLERLHNRPDVESAGIAGWMLPLSGGVASRGVDHIEGYEAAPGEPLGFSYSPVGPDYFRTLGIRVLRGREFDRRDHAAGHRRAVVNEQFVSRYWPNQDPVGKHVSRSEVVGVVADSRLQNVWTEPGPHVYELIRSGAFSFNVLVNTRGPAAAFAPMLRQEIAALDPLVKPQTVETLRDINAQTLGGQRLLMTVLAEFAAIAAIMALVGLYGLMAYTVAQRSREIGVRIAVGAQRSDILALVLKRGLGLTIAGIAFGLFIAAGLTRFLKSLLYDLSPTDPLTFALIAVGFTGIATLACLAPARRATKVDPVIALRAE